MKLELNNKVMINIKGFFNTAKIDNDVIANQYRVDLLESDNSLPKDIVKMIKDNFNGSIKVYQTDDNTDVKEFTGLKFNSVSYSVTDKGVYYNIIFVDAE